MEAPEVDWESTLFALLPAELGHRITTKYVTRCVDCRRYRHTALIHRGRCLDCRLEAYILADRRHEGRAALGALLSLGWTICDTPPCVPPVVPVPI